MREVRGSRFLRNQCTPQIWRLIAPPSSPSDARPDYLQVNRCSVVAGAPQRPLTLWMQHPADNLPTIARLVVCLNKPCTAHLIDAFTSYFAFPSHSLLSCQSSSANLSCSFIYQIIGTGQAREWLCLLKQVCFNGYRSDRTKWPQIARPQLITE